MTKKRIILLVAILIVVAFGIVWRPIAGIAPQRGPGLGIERGFYWTFGETIVGVRSNYTVSSWQNGDVWECIHGYGFGPFIYTGKYVNDDMGIWFYFSDNHPDRCTLERP